MRDFNSGDIHGNVTITENSNNNEYKLLIHCTNEELIQEEAHRQTLLSNERANKNGVAFKLLGLAALLVLIASGWYWLKGAFDIATLVVGVLGIAIGIKTLEKSERPTEFEQRQMVTLQEIHNLLRERGAR